MFASKPEVSRDFLNRLLPPPEEALKKLAAMLYRDKQDARYRALTACKRYAKRMRNP
jgi:hypothetical protein